MWFVSLRATLATSLDRMPERRQPVTTSGSVSLPEPTVTVPPRRSLYRLTTQAASTPRRMRSPPGAVFSHFSSNRTEVIGRYSRPPDSSRALMPTTGSTSAHELQKDRWRSLQCHAFIAGRSGLQSVLSWGDHITRRGPTHKAQQRNTLA